MAVGLLSVMILGSLVNHPTLPASLQAEVNLDNINFVSNDQLDETLSATSATPEQVEEAVRINTDARMRSLKASFLVLAAIALLAIFPAQGLPSYRPGEVPTGLVEENGKSKKKRNRNEPAAMKS